MIRLRLKSNGFTRNYTDADYEKLKGMGKHKGYEIISRTEEQPTFVPDEIVRIRSGKQSIDMQGHNFPGGVLTEKIPEKREVTATWVPDEVQKDEEDTGKQKIPSHKPGSTKPNTNKSKSTP